MTGPLVLVVDDEFAIRRMLRTTLERAGYAVAEAPNARSALETAADDRPDAILLDLGLPDRDGLTLVSLLKRQPNPAAILVISARVHTDDKVAALDLGADDYVSKPFDTEELLARLRVALRHRLADAGADAIVVAGDLTIDLSSRQVMRAGAEVHLTRKEYDVLAKLAAAPGRVVTHHAILAAAWPDESFPPIEYLRLVMRNLRLKLEADPARPSLLINELGVGYRFCGNERER